MWASRNQFRYSVFWSWCPALGPRRSRPGNRRKSLNGETGSPSPSSQREDGEPEESVRGASRSDSVGKQVSYSLAGAGGLEAGTVQRQRRAWGRWLEDPGPGGWAPGAPPGPFALPPPPSPRLRPSPLAGPSRRRPASPGTRPQPAARPPPGLRSRPPPLAARPAGPGLPRGAGCQQPCAQRGAPYRPALSVWDARPGAELRRCRLLVARWFPPPPARSPPDADAPLSPAPPSVKDARRAAAPNAGGRGLRDCKWRVPAPHDQPLSAPGRGGRGRGAPGSAAGGFAPVDAPLFQPGSAPRVRLPAFWSGVRWRWSWSC